jgi:hypothetical protein
MLEELRAQGAYGTEAARPPAGVLRQALRGLLEHVLREAGRATIRSSSARIFAARSSRSAASGRAGGRGGRGLRVQTCTAARIMSARKR